MKILILNLLRLGDVIMSVPVVNGLRAARPDARVDMLTFQGSAGLKPLIPGIHKWWTLDRDELQAGLGRADVPMLTSYSLLQERLDAISAEKYDLIINLSQSNFSAWVAGYLKAGERLGLTFDVKGIAHFYSPWFRYLNDHAEPGDQRVFHHSDIFLNACGLHGGSRDWKMYRTTKGDFEADALELDLSSTIVLQMGTSDGKKNLREDAWLDIASDLRDQQLIALGAPNEEANIDAFVARARQLGIKVKKAILGLEGALSLLSRSELLITGDTSIKHMANAAHCKVLELSLGSSDYRRTGVYKSDSLILQGRASCAPCAHSAGCGRPTHECGLAVNPQAVARAARLLVNEEWDQIEELATKNSGMRWLRTRELNTGFWFAQDLTLESPTAMVGELIERSAWKLALNRGRELSFVEFGSEGMSLRHEIKNLFGEEPAVLAHLDFLEENETRRAGQARSQLIELRRQGAPTGDLVQISGIRRQQIALETEYQHSEFKTKLIRTLKLHWRESI